MHLFNSDILSKFSSIFFFSETVIFDLTHEIIYSFRKPQIPVYFLVLIIILLLLLARAIFLFYQAKMIISKIIFSPANIIWSPPYTHRHRVEIEYYSLLTKHRNNICKEREHCSQIFIPELNYIKFKLL